MSTGLFPVRQTEAGRRKRQKPRGEKIAAFAEALANGASIRDAASLVGVSADYGRALLKRIRKDLGWQAR